MNFTKLPVINKRNKFTQPGLTDRQIKVLELITKGLPYKVIADELGISVRTMEKHRRALMRMVVRCEGVTTMNNIQLTHWAIAKGYVELMFSTNKKLK